MNLWSDMFFKIKKTIIFHFLFIYFAVCSANTVNEKHYNFDNLKWQISTYIGTQMSGIKSEDFVGSNYSSLLNISVGKWFSPSLALQLGYNGYSFNLISDQKRHYYSYYYGEAVLNLNTLKKNYSNTTLKWKFLLHAGSGYFYNYDYKRPNICANLGVSNNYRLAKNFIVSLKISAIMGWDIYQGNEDILPGLSLGVSYLLK